MTAVACRALNADSGSLPGPRIVCPLCHGAGLDDTAQVQIKLTHWLDDPDPDHLPSQVPEHLCAASAMASADAADRFARDAATVGDIIRAKLAAYLDAE